MEQAISFARDRNNTWHHINASSDFAIVFVHGYFSNAETCWKNKNGTYWPDLVISDRRIPPCSIFLGGYHTSIASGDYGVSDCASELVWALKRTGHDGSTPALSRQHIVFVCHSLGGVVTRYMLEAFREDFRSKNVGLCLMASPSIGSDYATSFGFLAELFKNRTGKQLQFFNPFLQDLDDRFMRFLETPYRTGSFVGAEAVEHHSPLTIFTPWLKPIVTKISGARYFAQRRTLAATNHSTIVKPDTHCHVSHEFLVDFINRFELPIEKETELADAQTPSKQTLAPLDVLFDVYQSKFEPFYIARELDRQIETQGEFRSIWLSGRTGIGKTCALKRYISNQEGRHLYLCLSQHGSNCSRDILLKEFAETFSITGQDVDPTYTGLITFLEQDRTAQLIYIDEVDAESDAGVQLLKLLGDLATTWKHRSDGHRLLFVVSSLQAPTPTKLPNNEKLRELFSFLCAEPWSEEEILSLHARIAAQLPELALQAHDLNKVIQRANGSPRFIKTFFWNRRFGTPDQTLDVHAALARTSEQLGAPL